MQAAQNRRVHRIFQRAVPVRAAKRGREMPSVRRSPISSASRARSAGAMASSCVAPLPLCLHQVRPGFGRAVAGGGEQLPAQRQPAMRAGADAGIILVAPIG